MEEEDALTLWKKEAKRLERAKKRTAKLVEKELEAYRRVPLDQRSLWATLPQELLRRIFDLGACDQAASEAVPRVCEAWAQALEAPPARMKTLLYRVDAGWSCRLRGDTLIFAGMVHAVEAPAGVPPLRRLPAGRRSVLSPDGRLVVTAAGAEVVWRDSRTSAVVGMAVAGAPFVSLSVAHASNVPGVAVVRATAAAPVPAGLFVVRADGPDVASCGTDVLAIGRDFVLRRRAPADGIRLCFEVVGFDGAVRAPVALSAFHRSELKVAACADGSVTLLSLGDDGVERTKVTAEGAVLPVQRSVVDLEAEHNTVHLVWRTPWEHAVVTADGRTMAFFCEGVCYVMRDLLPVSRFRLPHFSPALHFKNRWGLSFDAGDARLNIVFARQRRRSSRARCRVLSLPVEAFARASPLPPLPMNRGWQGEDTEGEEEESPDLLAE